MSLTIVMYHYVRDLASSRYPGIKGRDSADFIRQLDYIAANYSVVRTEDVIESVLGSKVLPGNAAWLTFDDGYKDHYDVVFPLLHARGWKGAFFPVAKAITDGYLLDVNRIHFILATQTEIKPIIDEIETYITAHRHDAGVKSFAEYWDELAKPFRWDPAEVIFIKRILQQGIPEDLRNDLTSRLFRKFVGIPPEIFAKELYASASQIKMMQRCGMYVGSHGHSHLWLNKIDADRQADEIDRSLEFLELVGAPTRQWVMCYPYGAYDDSVLSLLGKRDCALALTTKRGVANLDIDGRYELPRLDTNDVPIGAAADGSLQ